MLLTVVLNSHELLKARDAMTNGAQKSSSRIGGLRDPVESKCLHPAWLAFIRHCRDLGFGEISQLKIQDGLPVMAEETKKKVKFI
jgi:hypothetical protein